MKKFLIILLASAVIFSALISCSKKNKSVNKELTSQEILEKAYICAAARKGVSSELEEYAGWLRAQGARVLLPELDIQEVSSTQIRRLLQDGETADELLPAGIIDYIERNGLYVKND